MIRIQMHDGYKSWMARLQQADKSTEFDRGVSSVVASISETRGAAAIPMRLLKTPGLAAHPIHEVVAAVSFSELADETQEFVHGVAFAELGFWKLCLDGDWGDMPLPEPTEVASHRFDSCESAKPTTSKEPRRPHLRRSDDQQAVDLV